MKNWKLAGALGAAAIALLAPASHAQTTTTDITLSNGDTIILGAAGSSAQFKPFAIGVRAQVGAPLQTFTGTATTNDPSDTAAHDGGPFFVGYTGGNGSPFTIYYAVQTDSSVGNRLFFNRGYVATITNVDAKGNSTAQTIPGFNDSGDVAALPAQVASDIEQAGSLNAALTDILPADAVVATNRALAGIGGIVYNDSNPFKGNTTAAAGTGGSLAPVAFPAGANAISLGSEVVTTVGVDPVLVIVNSSNTGTGHLGNAAATNVGRFTLGRFLTGAGGFTSDIIQSNGLAASGNEKNPVTVFIREALSGTYNTMEFAVPASTEIGSTQEAGVTANPQDAPLFKRAIGTGREVAAVDATTDSLGYAFFGLGTFAVPVTPATTPPTTRPAIARYLTVDGVDPLFATYNGGAIPNANSANLPTFPNIANGTYPIFSSLRIVTATAPSANLNNVIGKVTSGDFLTPSQLRVFHAHHDAAGETASNGNNTATARAANSNPLSGRRPARAESGGDVGGAIFPINTDQNVYDATGAQITNIQQ